MQGFPFTSARSPEVSHISFLFYPSGLPPKVTLIFWASTYLAALPLLTALLPASCSSGQDFAIPFFSLRLTAHTLGIAMRLAMSTSATDFHRLDIWHNCDLDSATKAQNDEGCDWGLDSATNAQNDVLVSVNRRDR